MKKPSICSLLLSLSFCSNASNLTGNQASPVGWMQQGVRVWYYGGVGTTSASDAEEAYLITAVSGTTAQVTKHSGLNHWGSANPASTGSHSLLDIGPCWIHPQRLQTLASGDAWNGQTIATVLRASLTYDAFKASFPGIPYLLLPTRALFALKAQRDLVKIVYYLPDFSTGIAYFDAETGLLLLYETSSGFVTVFFLLSEINYDFATQKAFLEDGGPHTGFKSSVLEQQLMPFPDTRGGYVFVQSSVETRYGKTMQMWVSTSESGNAGASLPPFETYGFFGDVPILRHVPLASASNSPPDQWPPLGQYLWWWVPQGALQGSAIDVLDVSLTRTTSAAPYRFEAAQQPAGFHFTKLWFDGDGYLTKFAASDSNTGLDIDPERSSSYFNDATAVNGLSYYTSNMGRAAPAAADILP
jgi:hypothetical protein